VAVGVKDNPLGSVLVHVLVRDRIGRNCPHEHYCHDGEGDHRYENCSWKPVHDASNNCIWIDPTHARFCPPGYLTVCGRATLFLLFRSRLSISSFSQDILISPVPPGVPCKTTTSLSIRRSNPRRHW